MASLTNDTDIRDVMMGEVPEKHWFRMSLLRVMSDPDMRPWLKVWLQGMLQDPDVQVAVARACREGHSEEIRRNAK